MAYDNGRTVLGGNSLTGALITPAGAPAPGSTGLEAQGNVRGVFARMPGMTPKYHTGYSAAGGIDKSLEKMARMFIVFPNSTDQYNFIRTVPGSAQKYAKKLATSGSGVKNYGLGYIDFLLTQANESFSEKVQVVDVLADGYVPYFLGANPPVFRYSGWLLNSVQDDWRAAFSMIYQHIIRGTQLARRKVAITLAYDSVLVTGSILNMNQTLSAGMELAAPFSFDMLVKRYDVIPPLLPPTPIHTFPYKIDPDKFSSVIVEQPQKTLRDVKDPVLSSERTIKEQIGEPTVVAFDPLDEDIYNKSSEIARVQAENAQAIINSVIQNAPRIQGIALDALGTLLNSKV